MGKILIIKGADFSSVAVSNIELAGKIKITVLASPTGGGTTTGSGNYDEGSQVTISATANSGYEFVQWNDGNTNATRTITVGSSAKTYTATFKEKGWLLGIYGKEPSKYHLGEQYFYFSKQASANIAGNTISKFVIKICNVVPDVWEERDTPITFEIGYCDFGNEGTITRIYSGQVRSGQVVTLESPVTVPAGKRIYFKQSNVRSVSSIAKQADESVWVVSQYSDLLGGALASITSYPWIDFQ